METDWGATGMVCEWYMLQPLSLPDAAMLAELDKGGHVGQIVVGLSKPDMGLVLKTDVNGR